jgi:hypothetical protein
LLLSSIKIGKLFEFTASMSLLEEINFTLYHEGELHVITAIPYLFPAENGIPVCFDTRLNGKSIGDLNCNKNKWENENVEDMELLSKIGSYIYSLYK